MAVVVGILLLLVAIEPEIVLAAIAEGLLALFERVLDDHGELLLNQVLAEDDYDVGIELHLVFFK